MCHVLFAVVVQQTEPRWSTRSLWRRTLSPSAHPCVSHFRLPLRHGLPSVSAARSLGRRGSGLSQPHCALYLLRLGLHHCQVSQFCGIKYFLTSSSHINIINLYFIPLLTQSVLHPLMTSRRVNILYFEKGIGI